MTDITMIGLGAMGSALAKAFIGAGHSVTVWNRTAVKTEPLRALGAKVDADVSDAVQASSMIVVCLGDYENTSDLLLENSVGQHLSGRTLVQLGTGTPREAHDFERSARKFDCDYIDGAIMCYPDEVGAEDAMFLFSGPEAVFNVCQPSLTCLGGDLRYVGTNIKGAAALDTAFLTTAICSYLGVIHGVRICESENISADYFAAMFPDEHHESHIIRIIESGRFQKPGATISVWKAVLESIQTQSRDVGINSEIPDFISGFIERAIESGYGEEDIAAIIKVLRSNGVERPEVSG
jgi:3-hydroxyisobutyrate dehydrogenase-like beta-hydroxyacid dehydrogenase